MNNLDYKDETKGAPEHIDGDAVSLADRKASLAAPTQGKYNAELAAALEGPRASKWSKDAMRLYMSIFCALCCSYANGYDGSLMTAILAMKHWQDTMNVGTTGPIISVVFAIYTVGCLIGGPVSAWIMDRFGRRIGMVSGSIVIIVGSIIATTSKSVEQFIVARFVLEGLEALREVSQTKEHGLWLDPSDVTADDMASSTLGHNPWLATLYRTDRMEAAVAAVAAYDEEPWSYKSVVYGNVRIAFPTALYGPNAGSWLLGTCSLYGRSHPVALLAEHEEDKYDDGYDDEDEDDTPKPDLMVQMRYALCEAGVRHTSEPVLPLTPHDQELFERDPEAYYEMVCRDADDGAPRSHSPVGYAEWWKKFDEENARRRAEERGTNGLNSDDANT